MQFVSKSQQVSSQTQTYSSGIFREIFTGKSPRMPNTILKKKKKKKRRKHFPNVKDYHIAAVIETVVLSWDKHRDQWSRIQNPQIEPHQYA